MLKTAVERWTAAVAEGSESWNALLCILIEMPVLHPRTREHLQDTRIAFLTQRTIGEIGSRLGLLLPGLDAPQGSEPRYNRALKPEFTLDRIGDVEISPVALHRNFDASLASQLAGRGDRDGQKCLLIGAGALGSSLSELLVRMGLFEWTVADPDVLLPHNLARHSLTGADLGHPKALRLAQRLGSIRPDCNPKALPEAFSADPSEEMGQVLGDADVVIDAAASAAISRKLSDYEIGARCFTAFFNPSGTSAVLLAESADRKVTLRDAENVYLQAVLSDARLAGHIGPSDAMRYTGSCRAMTGRIPSARVGVLAGLIASGIAQHVGSAAPAAVVWNLGEETDVEKIAPEVSVTKENVGGWTVVLNAAVLEFLRSERRRQLPNETGGCLLGRVDHDCMRIDVVYALSAPDDSIGSEHGFIRGTRRLKRKVEKAVERSGSQVRYIGEWHSHPAGATADPSSTDIGQILELAVILDRDSVPAVSAIVSEDGIGIVLSQREEG